MKEFLDLQYKNLFFWAPIIMAFGAGLYFTLGTEPNIIYATLLFIVSIGILLFKRTSFILRGITIFLFGFLYAAIYTHFWVSTPILKHDLRNINITATVTDIDASDDKTRLTLSVPNKDLRLEAQGNSTIKLTIPDDTDAPNIGDMIHGNAFLFPPSPMEAPESFDYARWAYFNNLTATGFITDYKIVTHNQSANINNTRNAIHKKANSFLTDALVLGYKNAVSQNDKEVWTSAGIGHVWAISGFHMSIISAWLFAFFYFIFRAIGFITRRVPARITATVFTWIMLFAYVCISGFGVATMRAFLMLSLVFIALLLGRNAISMRNISIAFMIIFLANPHFVTTAGFQLSFAAIFGLIWFFGDKNFDTNQSRFIKAKKICYGAIMTAIIATLFTLPFIATHFNSIPMYGLIGNVILLPVFSVLIMPLVLLGTICALFGVHFMLNWATNIYDFALHIAQHITSLPMANINIPHVPGIAFIIFIIGLACLIFIKPLNNSALWIYRKANYVLFAVCILTGVIITRTNKSPVFYTTPDHELIGMVYDGKLEFNKARAANHYFAFDAFRKLNNEPHSDKNVRHKCDNGVCIYKTDNFTLAYIQKFVPLQKHLIDLCNDDAINFIVSYFDINSTTCNHKILHHGFVIYNSGKIKYTPFNRWWNNPHE